jgi:hypothetical protein
MLSRIISLFLLGLVSLGWGQGSAENLSRAHEGSGEESSLKEPNRKTSSFAGKMFESKSIQIKRHEEEQSELGKRLYASAGNSSYDAKQLQTSQECRYSGQKNEWSESGRSDFDGVIQENLRDRQEPLFHKKKEIQMIDLQSEEGPNWVTRRSPQYHQKNGELRMYEGRLVRVREKVSREEDLMRRDLGVGKQEIFNPEEVQKLLKPKNKPSELQTILPSDQQVKAESESAFQPVVVDSSLDSP